MIFIRSIKKKIIPALIAISVCTSVMAQDAGKTAGKTVNSSNNQLAILMIIIMLVLAFVIWGMGQVLVQLSRQVIDKRKSSSSVLNVLLLLGVSLLTQIASAQDKAATDLVKVVPNYGGLSATTFYLFLTVLVTEVVTILFLAFSIRRIYAELLPEKEIKPVKDSKLSALWAQIDKKFFTKAVPVEQEADVLLDHNYDGIRELDNALPPWWKYGFYITIGIAFIYLLNFHVLGLGKNPTEEYTSEMENARIEKEIFDSKNKDRIDENNVPMADADGLAKAKEIFTTKCWACHGKLGEGGAGPNLTDIYWLHKGSLNDIYHTIKTGYPDKGMQSWEKEFTPKEISQLASYVKTLHDTNPPNAKAPQGEIYKEELIAPAGDSIKNIIPGSALKK